MSQNQLFLDQNELHSNHVLFVHPGDSKSQPAILPVDKDSLPRLAGTKSWWPGRRLTKAETLPGVSRWDRRNTKAETLPGGSKWDRRHTNSISSVKTPDGTDKRHITADTKPDEADIKNGCFTSMITRLRPGRGCGKKDKTLQRRFTPPSIDLLNRRRTKNPEVSKTRLARLRGTLAGATSSAGMEDTPDSSTSTSLDIKLRLTSAGSSPELRDRAACDGELEDGGDYTVMHDLYRQLYPLRQIVDCFPWKVYVESEFDIINDQLSRGATSRIQLVKHRETQTVAVLKVLKIHDSRSLKTHAHEAENEMKVARLSQDSPFLLTILDGFVNNKGQPRHYIMYEFAIFHSLDFLVSSVNGMNPDKAAFYAFEIAKGIEFLHKNNIIHRDVKAENVVVTHTGHVVLGDFGSVHFLDEMPFVSGICGSHVSRPPEVWKHAEYNEKVDIWMFGITLWHILTNQFPFFHVDRSKQIERVKEPDLKFTPRERFNDNARDLISKVVVADPALRPDIKTVMKHDLFNTVKDGDTPPYSPRDLLTIYKEKLPPQDWNITKSLLQITEKYFDKRKVTFPPTLGSLQEKPKVPPGKILTFVCGSTSNGSIVSSTSLGHSSASASQSR